MMKMSIFGQNWPFLAKNPNAWEGSKHFGTLISGIRHHFRVENIDRRGSNAMGRFGRKCAIWKNSTGPKNENKSNIYFDPSTAAIPRKSNNLFQGDEIEFRIRVFFSS